MTSGSISLTFSKKFIYPESFPKSALIEIGISISGKKIISTEVFSFNLKKKKNFS